MPPVTFQLDNAAAPATAPPTGGGGPVTFDLDDTSGTGGTSAAFAPQAGYEPTGGLGAWARKNLEGVGGPAGWENPEAGGAVAGAVMSAGRGAATLLDLISDPLTKTEQIVKPGSIAEKAIQAVKGGKAEEIAQRMKSTADWLKTGSRSQSTWEKIGSLGEQALEYLLPSHYVQLAGPAIEATRAAEATEAATGAARSIAQIKNTQQVATTLANNPKLAGIVMLGLEQGSLQGAQTYLHTEDPGQAAGAAVVGGVLGAGASSLAEGARYLRGVRDVGIAQAAEAAEAAKPITMDVGGTPVSVLKEQVTPEGGLTGVTATGEGRPDVAETQQQDLQNVLQNKAQTSLAGVLNRANETRPMQFELAAVEPHYFKIGEGPNATWAEKQPPAGFAKAPLQSALTTSDPLEAAAWIENIDQHMRDPKLPQETFTQLNDMRQSLEDQLGLYHSSGQVQPVDVQAAVNNAQNFGDAGAISHGAARDIYQMIDQQTEGQFSKLREAEKKALGTMSDHEASNETVNKAQEDLENVRAQIDGLFDNAKANPGDVKAARGLYRDGLVYQQLHATVERMANGITLGDTESGLKRVVTGNDKLFENFLNKGNNRKLVSDLIGDQGIADLKTMFQLTRDANLTRKTAEVVDNVANETGNSKSFTDLIGSRFGKPGTLLALTHMYGGLGAALGTVTPLGAGKGYGIGVGVGLAHFLGKQIIENAATNGRVVNMIDFAVRHDIDPRIYAPLISRAIMVPQQKPEQPEQPQGGTQ